jgi:hypothetical protein
MKWVYNVLGFAARLIPEKRVSAHACRVFHSLRIAPAEV